MGTIGARLAALALAVLVPWGVEGAQGGSARDPASGRDLPGTLLERLEEAFESRAGALRWKHLEHYALVAPVEPADLIRFMAPISVRPDGRGFVPGAGGTAELHGGATLGFLFDHWRPEGRPARPADRFPFRSGPVALGAVYAGHRRQVFLPVPGRPADAIGGAIPDEARLARMRFFGDAPEATPVERDAYSFLRLLVAREEELDARWVNHLGQELSVDLLLGQAWHSYLRERGPSAEEEDHSRLHLVEILLAYERRAGRRERPGPHPDPDGVKRRFLAVELGRPVAETDDERLAHYAESLGWLVAHPGLDWGEAEKARARSWLRELEARFTDLESLEDTHLTHLLEGLRMVRIHAHRLRPTRR